MSRIEPNWHLVDVRSVLDSLGIEHFVSSSEWIACACPRRAGHKNGDHSPSMSVAEGFGPGGEPPGISHCRTCSPESISLLSLIEELEGLSYWPALAWLDDLFPGFLSESDGARVDGRPEPIAIDLERQRILRAEQARKAELRKLDDAERAHARADRAEESLPSKEFWQKLRPIFASETMFWDETRYDLKTLEDLGAVMSGRVLFIPVRDVGGRLRNVVRRSTNPESKKRLGKKTKYWPGVKLDACPLFPADMLKDLTKDSIVACVEGEPDVLRLRANGVEAFTALGGVSRQGEVALGRVFDRCREVGLESPVFICQDVKGDAELAAEDRLIGCAHRRYLVAAVPDLPNPWSQEIGRKGYDISDVLDAVPREEELRLLTDLFSCAKIHNPPPLPEDVIPCDSRDDASDLMLDILDEQASGCGSRQVVIIPGAGKDTSERKHLATRAKDHSAHLYLTPTRDLAVEFEGELRQAVKRSDGGTEAIVPRPLMGADEKGGDYHCLEWSRRLDRLNRGLSGCRGCPEVRNGCGADDGAGWRKTRERTELLLTDSRRDSYRGPPIICTGVIDLAEYGLQAAGKKAQLIMSDADLEDTCLRSEDFPLIDLRDWCLGMRAPSQLDMDILREAFELRRCESIVDRQRMDACLNHVLPFFLAKVVQLISTPSYTDEMGRFGWLLSDDLFLASMQTIDAFLAEIPSEFQRLLLAGELRVHVPEEVPNAYGGTTPDDRFPWDKGRTRFTSKLLDVLHACYSHGGGRAFTVECVGGWEKSKDAKATVKIPSLPVIRAFQEGRGTLLNVYRFPSIMAAALGIRVREIGLAAKSLKLYSSNDPRIASRPTYQDQDGLRRYYSDHERKLYSYGTDLDFRGPCSEILRRLASGGTVQGISSEKELLVVGRSVDRIFLESKFGEKKCVTNHEAGTMGTNAHNDVRLCITRGWLRNLGAAKRSSWAIWRALGPDLPDWARQESLLEQVTQADVQQHVINELGRMRSLHLAGQQVTGVVLGDLEGMWFGVKVQRLPFNELMETLGLDYRTERRARGENLSGGARPAQVTSKISAINVLRTLAGASVGEMQAALNARGLPASKSSVLRYRKALAAEGALASQ